MIRQGLADEAARALDPDFLAAAADIPLIKAAARAYYEARGFDAAHRLLADLRREPAIRTAPAFAGARCRRGRAGQGALHKILNERGYGGLRSSTRPAALAPDDLELHLLGVEVAVLEKKWDRAARSPRASSHPTALSDKARTLERLVDEGRRDEDSVTIRFNPGDKLIPVYAVSTRSSARSSSSTPGRRRPSSRPSAVAALEIRIDNSTPVVGFQGVAGGDLAFQVRARLDRDRRTDGLRRPGHRLRPGRRRGSGPSRQRFPAAFPGRPRQHQGRPQAAEEVGFPGRRLTRGRAMPLE